MFHSLTVPRRLLRDGCARSPEHVLLSADRPSSVAVGDLSSTKLNPPYGAPNFMGNVRCRSVTQYIIVSIFDKYNFNVACLVHFP
jgi:hypothetical protein